MFTTGFKPVTYHECYLVEIKMIKPRSTAALSATKSADQKKVNNENAKRRIVDRRRKKITSTCWEGVSRSAPFFLTPICAPVLVCAVEIRHPKSNSPSGHPALTPTESSDITFVAQQIDNILQRIKNGETKHPELKKITERIVASPRHGKLAEFFEFALNRSQDLLKVWTSHLQDESPSGYRAHAIALEVAARRAKKASLKK
jgi:hypothetical protein